MTAARSAYEWWIETGELAAFLRALTDGQHLRPRTIIEIVEKPWRWTDEHTAWLAAGRPESYAPDPDALTKGHGT